MLCQAAKNRDVTAIARVLRHRKRSSSTPYCPLQPSGYMAKQILLQTTSATTPDSVTSTALGSSTGTSCTILTPELGVALLWSPSSYETPWEAACVLLPQHLDHIQCFLQHTTSVWWNGVSGPDEKNSQNDAITPPSSNDNIITVPGRTPLTPRRMSSDHNTKSTSLDWMFRLIQKCLQYETTYPLIHSLITVISQLEEDRDWWMDQILDSIVRRTTRLPDTEIMMMNIPSWTNWIQICTELRFHLREVDWTYFYTNLATGGWPVEWVNETMANCVFLITDYHIRHLSPQSIKSWMEIVYQFWFAVAAAVVVGNETAHRHPFRQYEEQFRNTVLISWSVTEMKQYLDHLPISLPPWLKGCCILQTIPVLHPIQLVRQALLRHTGCSVGTPAARSNNKTGGQNDDLLALCWDQLALLSQTTTATSRDTINEESGHNNSVFLYRGRGWFNNQRWTSMGRMVIQTLVLSDSSSGAFDTDRSDDADQPLVVPIDIALHWLKCAHWAMNQNAHSDLALAVMVTLYFEVPPSRSIITANIRQCLVSQTTEYCQLCSILFEYNHNRSDLGLESLANEICSTKLNLSQHRVVVDTICQFKIGCDALFESTRRFLLESSMGRDCHYYDDQWECSLYALVTLLSVSDQNDLQIRAWKLLWHTIQATMDRQMQTRMWELLRSSNCPSRWTSHLLRATLCRLLSTLNDTFVSNQDSKALLMLVMDLVSHSASDETLQAWRIRCKDFMERSAPIQLASNIIDVTNPNLPNQIAIYIVSRCLYSLFHISPEPTTSPVGLMDVLIDQEAHELACSSDDFRSSLDLVDASLRCFPCDKAAICYCYDTADIIIEFLFGSRWTRNGSKGSQCAVSHFASILSAQRSLRDNKSMISDPRFVEHTILFTYIDIIQKITTSIDRVVRCQGSPVVLDKYVWSIMELCKRSRNISGYPEIIVFQWIKSLESVYETICSEAASIRLISYFENYLRSSKLALDTFDLKAIKDVRSEDQIDGFIRMLRSFILDALERSLKGAKITISGSVQTTENTQASASCPLLKFDFPLLLRCLSLDARNGVQGKSGGLSQDMFLSYLACLENISLTLKQGISSHPSYLAHYKGDILAELRCSALSLEGLFCLPDLNRSLLFKKLLRLSTKILPLLSRAVLTASMRIGEEELAELLGGSQIFESFLIQCLSQVTSVLGCMARGERPDWQRSIRETETDVGNASSDTDSHETAMKPKSLSKGCSMPHAEVVTPPKASYEAQQDTLRLQPLVLHSERFWTTTLCITLEAIDDDLMEATQTMDNNLWIFSTYKLSKLYVASRTVVFRRYFSALSLFLQRVDSPSKKSPKSPKDRSDHRLCAMSLSPKSKSRLRVVLDRTCALLTQSTKIVCEVIQNNILCLSKGMTPIRLMEALSCVIGWLSNDQTDRISDITCGIRIWSRMENEIDEVTSGRTIDEESPLRKHLKMENSVDELETNLKRLQHVVHDAIVQWENGICLESALRDIDSLFKSLESGFDLTGLIADKLKRMLDRKELKRGVILKRRSATVRKRKATEVISNTIKTDRRRPRVRSRNMVVDRWLEMDREIGREAMDDDAYADLEDFIVDG